MCTFLTLYPANIRLDKDFLKTSWRCLSSSSSEEVLIKTNIFVLLMHLHKTSSRRFDQDQYIRLGYTSWRHLQDAFKMYIFENVLKKTSSRRPQGVFKTSCENVLRKAPSRHFQDILQICLQDVFKTYYQVKLFLLTQFQDVFETYSKRFWDVLLKRLSTGGLPRSHFWEIYGQCKKFPRMIKVSQVLIFHFIF